MITAILAASLVLNAVLAVLFSGANRLRAKERDAREALDMTLKVVGEQVGQMFGPKALRQLSARVAKNTEQRAKNRAARITAERREFEAAATGQQQGRAAMP